MLVRKKVYLEKYLSENISPGLNEYYTSWKIHVKKAGLCWNNSAFNLG